MAFTDLQLKVAAEAGVQAIRKHLAPLQDFAHTYSELNDRKGASIAVPVYSLSAAADFVAGTNDYGSGVNEIDGQLLTLDKHFVKSLMITDRQEAETDIHWIKDGSEAIAKVLGNATNAYVFGMINATNCALTASFDGSSKAVFANLFKDADDNGLDPFDTVVALTPEYYSKLLSYLDSNVYGGSDAIVDGRVPGLYGFASVVATSNLPSGTKGALIPRNSIGIASRYLEPLADAYPQTWKATGDDGFTIGYRVFQDLKTGYRYMAGEALVGAKLFYPGKIVRLI